MCGEPVTRCGDRSKASNRMRSPIIIKIQVHGQIRDNMDTKQLQGSLVIHSKYRTTSCVLQEWVQIDHRKSATSAYQRLGCRTKKLAHCSAHITHPRRLKKILSYPIYTFFYGTWLSWPLQADCQSATPFAVPGACAVARGTFLNSRLWWKFVNTPRADFIHCPMITRYIASPSLFFGFVDFPLVGWSFFGFFWVFLEVRNLRGGRAYRLRRRHESCSVHEPTSCAVKTSDRCTVTWNRLLFQPQIPSHLPHFSLQPKAFLLFSRISFAFLSFLLLPSPFSFFFGISLGAGIYSDDLMDPYIHPSGVHSPPGGGWVYTTPQVLIHHQMPISCYTFYCTDVASGHSFMQQGDPPNEAPTNGRQSDREIQHLHLVYAWPGVRRFVWNPDICDVLHSFPSKCSSLLLLSQRARIIHWPTGLWSLSNDNHFDWVPTPKPRDRYSKYVVCLFFFCA